MFTHDFTNTFAVIKEAWIRDFAFELFEAFTFALNKGIKVHTCFSPKARYCIGGGASTERGGYSSAKLSSLSGLL